MNLKPSRSLHVLLLASLLALAGLVQGADTPSGPSTSERLDSARRAIETTDWRKAESELTQAARTDPRNADVQNLLGYLWRKRPSPNLDKAFEHYNAALRLDPRHKGAHEYIGEAYLMANKPAEAEKHLAQLESICGNRSCEEYADLAKAIAAYKARN